MVKNLTIEFHCYIQIKQCMYKNNHKPIKCMYNIFVELLVIERYLHVKHQ